ncbi:hypothetical protein [Shimia sp.]|uniref:hypothetical protein n=1 Tax=Shimia sp. TaxID=1954381 RepID=UPI003297CDD3
MTELEQELSTSSRDTASKPSEADVQESSATENVKNDEDGESQLQDIERLLDQHGLDVDEMKKVLEHFMDELKDLPSTKPMLTVFGAFLLGYFAGRNSR